MLPPVFLPAVPLTPDGGNLSRYLTETANFHARAEGGVHARQGWREHGDPEAAHKLVTSHLRLVAKIAMGYRGYGLPPVAS